MLAQGIPYNAGEYMLWPTGTAFRVALYDSDADLDYRSVTNYTTTNEIVGSGYVAGGEATTFVGPTQTGTIWHGSFADVMWSGTDFTTRAALIYRDTAPYYVVAVLDFGTDKIASGDFTLTMPANTSSDAIFRINMAL
jgi:hypothetical protein